MALPNFALVTSDDVGAPVLTGQNGSGNALLQYIIVTVLGGTRIYHDNTTNQSVWQFPDGQILYACHDSALSGGAQRMVVRMAEGATGYTYSDLVNPFPLVSQAADVSSNWLMSNTANATARQWRAVVHDGGIVLAVETTTDQWSFFPAGLVTPRDPTDPYAVVIGVKTNTSNTHTSTPFVTGYSATANGTTNFYWQRSKDGLVLSTTGAFWQNYAAGSIAGAPTMSGGLDGDIAHTPLWLNCSGSQTTTADTGKSQMFRGALPNVRNPLVSGIGSYSPADTLTDSAYAPGCVLRPLSVTTNTVALLQETNDWHPN
jgi:hypothetical protein